VILTTFFVCFGIACAQIYLKNEESIDVETSRVEISNIEESVFAAGTVEEKSRTDIYPEEHILLSKIYVKQGDFVKKGQRIADGAIISSEYATSDMFLPNIEKEMKEAMKDIAGTDVSEEIIHAVMKSYTEAARKSGVYIAGVEKNDANGKKVSLYSSADGTVMDVYKNSGEFVPAMTAIMDIADLRELSVKAKVPEEFISSISKGTYAEIEGAAFPGMKYSATVDFIMPYAQKNIYITQQGSQSAKIDVILNFKNYNGGLKPGYTVQVRFATNQKNDSMLVPYEAILQDDSGREYVFAAKEGRAIKKMIETGSELDESIEVVRGLKEDDQIILSPPKSLRPGSKINTTGVKDEVS